jgi:prepilin-type N-terminal cleavage/methylation domain-containing protein
MAPMLKKKFKEAFTLVELIVVLAIIGVLAGVSVGAYFGITTKAKKTAALAEANMIRTQLYAIATQSGGFKSGQLSNNGVQFPDNIEYFTADLLSSYTSGMRKANGGASGPSIEFNFYSDAYQTEVDSSLNDYVRLGIGYLLAASAGSINTATINKYASEVYVSTTDGTISSFDVVKDGMWVSTSVSQPATDLVGSTPTVIDVRVSPTKPTSGTDTSLAAWTNWYASDKYTRYLSRYKSVDETKDGQTKAFMKASAYRVGNQNALDLGPHVEALLNGNPISLADLSGGASSHDAVTYKVTEAGVDKTSTYLDVAAADPAAKGLVKFTAAAAGKNVVLTFTYGNGTNANFPNISYNISVVDGLNVTDAKTFFALNNATDFSGKENGILSASATDRDRIRVESILAKYTELSSLVNYSSGVFQSDLTISKKDIPDFFIWQENELNKNGVVVAPSIVGSLKDESYFVMHRHSATQTKFDIYGNYFKLSLGTDVPKIASDLFLESQQINPSGEAPNNTHIVESHSAIFSDKQQQWLTAFNETTDADLLAAYPSFETRIHDLSSTGNHGVSDLSDTKHSGLCFYKGFNPSLVENCNLNSFYIDVMDNGQYVPSPKPDGTNEVAAKGIHPTMEVNNCRMFDSGNVSIFLSNEGTINVSDSEIRKAGGPLAIAYSNCYSLNDKKSARVTVANGHQDPRSGSWINFTNCTMENWVTGQGGWFKIHSVEDSFTTLKTMDQIFNGQLSRAFTKSGKINLLAVMMGDHNTTDGGFLGGIKVGDENMIDFENGRSDFESTHIPYNSDYGNMYMFNNCYFKDNTDRSSPVFKTMSNGVSHYAALNATGTGLVNTKFYATNQAGDAALDKDGNSKTLFGLGDYLGMYYFGQKPIAGGVSDPTAYPSYAGSDAYGILMTLSDFTA